MKRTSRREPALAENLELKLTMKLVVAIIKPFKLDEVRQHSQRSGSPA